MRLRLALFLYNLLFPIALGLMLPRLLTRMVRRGNFRHKFGQRLGFFDRQTRERLSSGNWSWIHSISVGETVVALKLARKMKELQSDLRVVLSVTTSTGFAQAEKEKSEWLEVIYNPIDGLPIVRRALRLIQPRQLIFVEGIWPNLLAQSKRRGLRTTLIARLSPRSEKRFRRFRFFTAPLFRLLDLVCVQDRDDSARWAALGVEANRIECTGSIKFDHIDHATNRADELAQLLESAGVPRDAPVVVAGSTFPGEEKILCTIFNELRPKFPDLFLVIVPRHVERVNEVAADITATGLRFILRTALSENPQSAFRIPQSLGAPHSENPQSAIRNPHSPDCLLVNTTGELSDWYRIGTVNFVGKSLTATGGQNPVEAVAGGAPAVFGPHMENFSAIVDRWLQNDAAIQVSDAAELKTQLARLLSDPTLRKALASHAIELLAPHRGATERTAALLT
jgi:3-deoxy-D-manno-octulosonic-acid transferase